METTNFFKQIAALDFTGVLQLSISKGIENNLIVSVFLNNESCADSAKNTIAPLTFNASPEEFDKDFFEQITTPIQKVSGLLVDMDQFLKQLEETKKQSAIEKEQTEKAKKEMDSKAKKYKDAMAKADELEKEGKFREAWMKVPDASEFPDKTEQIKKRKAELSNQFEQNSLFGLLEETKVQQPKVQDDNDDGQNEVSDDFQTIETEKQELNF